MKKVYYYETIENDEIRQNLTTNEIESNENQGRLATFEDLDWEVCCKGKEGIFDGLVELQDGVFEWQEEYIVDEDGDRILECGYRMIL